MTRCAGVKKAACLPPCAWTVGKGCSKKKESPSVSKSVSHSAEKSPSKHKSVPKSSKSPKSKQYTYSLKFMDSKLVAFFLDYYKKYDITELPINTSDEMKQLIEYCCWKDSQSILSKFEVPEHLNEIQNRIEKAASKNFGVNKRLERFITYTSYHYLFGMKH